MRLNLANLKNMKPDMTIGELVNSIENKNKEQETENILFLKKVIDEYTGKYLKIYKPNGIFGTNIEIYKIDSIKSMGYDTDFNQLFGIIGTKINFSKRDLSKYDVKGEISNSFTYNQLQQTEIIEAIDYNFYLSQYTQITNNLKFLLNE